MTGRVTATLLGDGFGCVELAAALADFVGVGLAGLDGLDDVDGLVDGLEDGELDGLLLGDGETLADFDGLGEQAGHGSVERDGHGPGAGLNACHRGQPSPGRSSQVYFTPCRFSATFPGWLHVAPRWTGSGDALPTPVPRSSAPTMTARPARPATVKRVRMVKSGSCTAWDPPGVRGAEFVGCAGGPISGQRSRSQTALYVNCIREIASRYDAAKSSHEIER